jgi:hypothetical protein
MTRSIETVDGSPETEAAPGPAATSTVTDGGPAEADGD